ncbi:MAG: glycosyltransferase [Acidobacteria bacterium]|nr:glycosyltransferase [Acidobacteriota bacterium]
METDLLKRYEDIVNPHVVKQLRRLAEPLRGKKIVHINSTKEGGGVAEILHKMIPLMNSLGLEASWEIIEGNPDFYKCTKTFHNALQGLSEGPGEDLLRVYEETNKKAAKKFGGLLGDADFVFIHDPQPAAFFNMIPKKKGKWIWRCHIDVSKPNRSVWRYMRKWVSDYHASIFSLPDFALPLPHRQYIIPPSIDPLSDKNKEIPAEDIIEVMNKFNVDPVKPIILQVSRFDKFKDPIGVINSYRIASKQVPLQLILAGGGASDDPEGAEILKQVKLAAEDDPNIFILDLPPDAHLTINALQRAADIVLQKSIKEGFGLTVTEAMWKRKPVIGGDAGGIRLQVINHYTGFLVRSPEGAALRIRYLLHHRDKLQEMGNRAHRLVTENFLLTRHLRDYLSLMISLNNDQKGSIRLYE